MSALSDARRQEGERLLRQAFDAARASGREDWRQMTTAVLKNRLLTLTNREFNERDWGERTFKAFVELFPDVISIDTSVFPPIATLRNEEGTSDSAGSGTPDGKERRERPMTPHQRVRADLWRAVLDFSSGTQYRWDEANSAAVPTEKADGTNLGPVVPTVTPEVLQGWRDEFIARYENLLSPPQVQALHRWKDEGLGTHSLPASVRGRWNGHLKERVVERLGSWFDENGITAPTDLIEVGERTPQVSSDAERLRELVLACVAVMTRQELEGMTLPPSAVLRARKDPR